MLRCVIKRIEDTKPDQHEDEALSFVLFHNILTFFCLLLPSHDVVIPVKSVIVLK